MTTWPAASTPCTWKTDLAMSRPIVVIVCIVSSSPNRGSFNSAHIRGTHVPVEEPSTASTTDMGLEASICQSTLARQSDLPYNVLRVGFACHGSRAARSGWTQVVGDIGRRCGWLFATYGARRGWHRAHVARASPCHRCIGGKAWRPYRQDHGRWPAARVSVGSGCGRMLGFHAGGDD